MRTDGGALGIPSALGGSRGGRPVGRGLGAAGQSQRRPQLISSGAAVGGALQSCPEFGQASLAWTGPWTWAPLEGGACPGARQLPSAQGHSRRSPSGP